MNEEKRQPTSSPAPEAVGGQYKSDENTLRGNWSNKLDCILALIGYSVGFGNVWRFPYLCYRNGGGAFLIPYFIMLVLAGIPLYYIELIVGQYSSLGPIAIWNMSPLFRGVGYSTTVVTCTMCTYFNTLIAYCLYYLFMSMTSELPWTGCGHPWNTPACKERSALTDTMSNSTAANYTLGVTSATTTSLINASFDMSNITRVKSPAEEFFERNVLDLSSGIEDMGPIRWQLLLCLILAWVLNFLVLIKGIKSAGKVVYLTATFPYIVFFILLGRGLTLPGSMSGIRYYFFPQWDKLLSIKVWGEAAVQIFYSLGPCWGGLIAFASFNKFHNNIFRDMLVCSFTCCGSSVLAGAVVFSVIGFMAYDLNVSIDQIITSGPGLVFVAYPEALAQMPIGPLWSVIFFFMLLTVGIDCQFSMIEMMVAAISDEFPNTLRKHKTLFTLGVCIFCFFVGLPQVTRGGIYLLNLIDWYIALFSVLVIGLFEVVVVTYIYGYRNLSRNAKVMVGRKPGIYFIATWCFFTPLTIMAICVFNAMQHTTVVYYDYVYPTWSVVIGWLIAIVPLVPIPAYMIYMVLKRAGSFQGLVELLSFPWTGETIKVLCQPKPDWGPMMPQFRREAGLPPTHEVMTPLNDLPLDKEKEAESTIRL